MLKLFIDFFNSRAKCPFCGDLLTRQISISWNDIQTSFVSLPQNVDDYQSYIFHDDWLPVPKPQTKKFSLKELVERPMYFDNATFKASLECYRAQSERTFHIYYVSAFSEGYLKTIAEHFLCKDYSVLLGNGFIEYDSIRQDLQSNYLFKFDTAESMWKIISKILLLS